MSYSALQDTPIVINLLTAANDNGWTQDGVTATHSSCNDGVTTNDSYPLFAGQSYQVSYAVLSISDGYVQVQSPGSNGAEQTTANLYVETITPTSNGFVDFYSNANCQIQAFNIQNITPDPGNTIAYSAKTKKWSDFRSFYPDYGWSLYTRSITAYRGNLYTHDNGSDDRCNFYGTQFTSSIKFSTNQQPTIPKTFLSINYQANQLLITPSTGVTTSLGQVSNLVSQDFLQAQYNDGSNLYTSEGFYKASFLRDMNVDIISGDPLKGNWLQIDLVNTSPSSPLSLFSTEIIYAHSYGNTR